MGGLMSYTRRSFLSRPEWLAAKQLKTYKDFKISGTEAPIVCGHSPWQTPADLYDIKLGIKERKNITDKPYVQYGIKSEPLIRQQMMIEVPYFSLEYHEYDILESVEHPWMTCTLDGELEVISKNPWAFPIGSRGVLEIKTGSYRTVKDCHGWFEGIGIPAYYYEQMIHCLAVTGYDFVINPVRLHRDPWKDEDMGFPEIKTFYRLVDRRSTGVQRDIEALIGLEKEFIDLLKNRKRPPVKIKFGE